MYLSLYCFLCSIIFKAAILMDCQTDINSSNQLFLHFLCFIGMFSLAVRHFCILLVMFLHEIYHEIYKDILISFAKRILNLRKLDAGDFYLIHTVTWRKAKQNDEVPLAN